MNVGGFGVPLGLLGSLGRGLAAGCGARVFIMWARLAFMWARQAQVFLMWARPLAQAQIFLMWARPLAQVWAGQTFMWPMQAYARWAQAA